MKLTTLALTLAVACAWVPQHVSKQAVPAQLRPTVSGRDARPATRLDASVLDEADLERDLAETLQPLVDLGLTVMRVGTCALMVHHGIDKIEARGARHRET